MARKRPNRVARILRYVYLKLVRKNDAPERVARGAGFGILVGVFPTLYLGPVIAAGLAGWIGANRAAALLGNFASGPLTPITWTLCVLVGNLLVRPENRIARELIESHDTGTVASRFLGTFMLGNVIVSVVLAVVGYLLVWWLAERHHRRTKARSESPRKSLTERAEAG